MSRGTCLKLVKINNIDIVPRYLVEQVKPSVGIDEFYKWAKLLFANPLNFLGVFIDKQENIHGFLWTSFNPIDRNLHAHMVSIDKEYQRMGIAKEIIGILNKQKKQAGAIKICASTTRPMAFEKYGFKISESTMMEL